MFCKLYRIQAQHFILNPRKIFNNFSLYETLKCIRAQAPDSIYFSHNVKYVNPQPNYTQGSIIR